MERVDIAIIGTGPAGVSAALTAANRNKTILLLGSHQMSEKVAQAHEIRNYPGLPAVRGADLAAAFRNHLESSGIEITEKRVGAVYAMGDYFALQIGEEMAEARPLYKGKTAAVIGYSPREEAEAAFLSEVCAKVMYFPMYKGEPELPAGVEIIREKVTGIGQEDGKRVVRTENGSYAADGVFVLREAVAPDQLVPGLEADGAHVRVNRKMETSLPGVFACGDLTGTPYQYVKAAGEGNVAAISAAAYIDGMRRAQK